MGQHPDAPHLHRLAGMPVFITGPHRSGTTLLYALLLATGRFNGVTACHVLRHRQLLADHLAGDTDRAKADLAEQFRAAGITDRVIDGVRVTPARRGCGRPNELLAGVLGWLGLDAAGVPDVSAQVAPRSGPLLPAVARLWDYYPAFGYDPGG